MPHIEVTHRGEDKTIIITAKDADSNIIDLDTASEIIVRLLDESKNTIEKFSKTVTVGFETLDIPNPNTGIMNLFLNAAKTDVAAKGLVDAELKLRFADTNFDNDEFDAVTTIKNVTEIKDSKTKEDL